MLGENIGHAPHQLDFEARRLFLCRNGFTTLNGWQKSPSGYLKHLIVLAQRSYFK